MWVFNSTNVSSLCDGRNTLVVISSKCSAIFYLRLETITSTNTTIFHLSGTYYLYLEYKSLGVVSSFRIPHFWRMHGIKKQENRSDYCASG
jgi:hypothetical protein